ncbi:LysR substrate-binding domain-containing protein [Photobacterium minamisatsumaniensis]|uniref:LysR substrate-binding domain-containing protein n=1 Tax=Photobacterium minamisatsumaniensis TaxID=2910233 RepID=UPI003D13B8AA
MYKWEGVSEFIAVSEAESFTAASRRLGISTAQVSRQISTLENRLDTKLFNRTTRRVSVTDFGKIYYRHCRQLLDGLEEAELALGNMKSTPQGRLRVSAPVCYGEDVIAPLIESFIQSYPKLNIHLDLTDAKVDLIAGGYDLAIRIGDLNDSTLMAKRLGTRTEYICASEKYLTKYGIPHSLAELVQHNCLLGSLDHWRFIDNGKLRKIRVKGNMRCNSGHVLTASALKGNGIVQLSDYYVNKHINSGELIPILTEYENNNDGIWAIYPHNRHLSPKVRMLIDYLCEKIRPIT